MLIFYKSQINMDFVDREYRILRRSSNVPLEVFLGEHDEIGPKDSDLKRLYNKDYNTICSSVRNYYGKLDPDLVVIDGKIDGKHAPSRRTFKCRMDAFRLKNKRSRI